jgi:Zn-finger nucleic acid-binding protein
MTLACPECKLDLTPVDSGPVAAHRCSRCRGIWLDPASFQRLCETEASPPVDETAIVLASPARRQQTAPRPEDRVRYRPCPACGEVMNRSNFGRVSGVIVDVCRPHGAWLDRGELAAIRRFLRDGGLNRYERKRKLDDELRSTPVPPGPPGGTASLDVLYDLLVGGGGVRDLPSRIPRLLLVVIFAILGGLSLWAAFAPDGFGDPGWMLGPALVFLYFGWRALRQWMSQGG